MAQEFAKALKLNTRKKDGYLESDEAIVTWCVGHLVTMSYPEVYDEKYKRWSLETLPFMPKEFKYEVIPNVKKQFQIVSGVLNRQDVDTIYVCTDSGREGEYIYRLVEQMAEVKGKKRKRVWIDSQTEEEILRGIREAKDLEEYDNLSASAYLRAKEDYLMGINFSRLLTLKYGNSISNYLGHKYTVLSVGRVMTCVLGMVVRREREIREFVKTPFYRVLSSISLEEKNFDGEWKAVKGSKYFESLDLYKENGFKEKVKAEELIAYLSDGEPLTCTVTAIEKKKEKKKRESEEMRRDYPQIINRFSLYIGAGMSVRNAWQRITEDYRKNKERTGRRKAYEEMIYTENQMKNKAAESECYEEYGIRCGLSVYRRFGTLLSQNLRKGSKGLSELLKRETGEMFEERKKQARKLGEEAGTKLMIRLRIWRVIPDFLPHCRT